MQAYLAGRHLGVQDLLRLQLDILAIAKYANRIAGLAVCGKGLLHITLQLLRHLGFQQIAKCLHLVPLQAVFDVVRHKNQQHIGAQLMQATGQINAVQRAHINIQKSQIIFCQRQSTQLRCICGAIHRGARHLRLYDGLYLFRQLTGKGCVVIANQYAHGKILLFGIFARRVLAGICCKHNLLPPLLSSILPKIAELLLFF